MVLSIVGKIVFPGKIEIRVFFKWTISGLVDNISNIIAKFLIVLRLMKLY